jgi:hypothetical protein
MVSRRWRRLWCCARRCSRYLSEHQRGYMKKAITIWAICVSVLSGIAVTPAATLEQKLVTRVDTATVVLKHKALTINATGMGRTPTPMGRGGKLLRRKSDRPLNKDGLVEYDLVFHAVPNYTGFKLKPIKAKVTDRSVPEGVKGVRVFGEYNQVDALLPVAKTRKSWLPFRKKRYKESQETTGAITGSSPHP